MTDRSKPREPFRGPYGGTISHVPNPRDHHGYRYIVAWSAAMGSYASYIKDRCDEARADDAPKDAVYRRNDGTWARFDRTWPDAERYQSYVDAMIRYENDDPARRTGRGT
ncbi:hypothetical protein ACTWP5_18835 [Streptomyces sp. 4N509B]|uniref:hypothetical protein n=1 Tax=Streptomyces sp. 4N509B TaxID=3457413 RepID=UPI003FD19162